MGGFGHIPLLSVAPLPRSSCLLAALVTCLCCRVSVRLIDGGCSLLLQVAALIIRFRNWSCAQSLHSKKNLQRHLSALNMQPLPGGFRRRGYSEIAISPFDPAQLVHASGSDRNAQSRDLVMLPSPASNAEWIRQTASVRLSSGCAVTVALESTSAVPLMHMLQVNLILFFHRCISFTLPPSLLRSGALAAASVSISFSRSLCLNPSEAPQSSSGTRRSEARIPLWHALLSKTKLMQHPAIR